MTDQAKKIFCHPFFDIIRRIGIATIKGFIMEIIEGKRECKELEEYYRNKFTNEANDNDNPKRN